jgi:hypothetical protein
MGVSHHALWCFLNDAQPIRTRERTLGKIEAGLHRLTPYPTDLVLEWVKSDLSWLETHLTERDVADVLLSIRRCIKRRRTKGYWVSYER